jgi:hypothetical protein
MDADERTIMTITNFADGLVRRSTTMSLWRAAQWLNRHGTSWALLVLLLALCAFAHFLAATKIEVLRGLPLEMDAQSLRREAGIQFIHQHWWFVLPYVTFFAGSLVWLEAREAPRWSVWSVFAVLAIPCLMYLCICSGWAFMGFVVTMTPH